MRTNIVINDKLMSQALRLSGFKTKRDAVVAGLEMLVKWPGNGKFARHEASFSGKAISSPCDPHA